MRYTAVQLYQPVLLPYIQSVQLPYNQTVHEMNMHLQKYNRYMTYSATAHVCTHPICYVAHVCTLPNCYASYVFLLKTRVSFFLKTSDPL